MFEVEDEEKILGKNINNFVQLKEERWFPR